MSHCLQRSTLSLPLKKCVAYCTSTTNNTSMYLWKAKKGYANLFHESQALANSVLLDSYPHENKVASPVSFHLLLGLLAAGSGVSGRREFLNFFNVLSMDNINASVSLLNESLLRGFSFGPCIRSSTSLWHHHSLSLHPFLLNSLYVPHRVSLIPINFLSKTQLASQQINSRVEDDTNGIIKDFISEEYLINPSVKMVISNTLYFKGEWNVDCMLGKGDAPAVKSSDMPENFAVAEMFAVRRTIIGDAEEGYFIFGGSFKRPNDDKRGLNLLCGYPLPQAVYDLDDNDETLMEVGGVPVLKFSVSSEVDASTTLRGLGIKLPFSGGELTHMLSPSENLYVFKIVAEDMHRY